MVRAQLQRYGRVLGPIRNLRAATKLPEFSHLFGFRRQAFVEFFSDQDADALPARVHMVHDGLAYTMYLHAERPCTSCGAFNHRSSGCPQSRLSSLPADPITRPPPPAASSPQDPPLPASSLPSSHQSAVARAPSTPLTTAPLLTASSPTLPGAMVVLPPPESTAVSRPCSPSHTLTSSKKRRPSAAASALSSASEPTEDADVHLSADDNDSVADSVDYDGLMDFSELDPAPSDSSLLPPPPPAGPSTSTSAQVVRAPPVPFPPSVRGPLDGKRLNQFIKEVKGSPTPLTFVSQYTSNLPGLIQQLRDYADVLRKHKANSALSARIANLARRLEKGALALS